MKKKKTLEELLTEHAAKMPSFHKGSSRLPQFLAVKEEVIEALNKGWSAKDIWRVLYEQKRFNGQYNCFVIYVRTFSRVSESQRPEPEKDISANERQTAHTTSRENATKALWKSKRRLRGTHRMRIDRGQDK